MTSYFDQLQREVSLAAKQLQERDLTFEERTAQFIQALHVIETRAIAAVKNVADLAEFPADLKTKIVRAIVRAGTIEGTQYCLTMLSSELIGDLHSIFHEVARLRIQTPFGVLSDDPESTLKRLNANGKDAFEDHLKECPECARIATLGSADICADGKALQDRWTFVNDRMAEGVPVEQWPK